MAAARIGFIGLGSQGGPMAERIVAAGHSLTVWARRAEVLEPFLAAGASADALPAGRNLAHLALDHAGERVALDRALECRVEPAVAHRRRAREGELPVLELDARDGVLAALALPGGLERAIGLLDDGEPGGRL